MLLDSVKCTFSAIMPHINQRLLGCRKKSEESGWNGGKELEEREMKLGR